MSWSIPEFRRILLAGDRSCLILLVPFCILGFLTGCGGGSSDTATVSPTPTPTPMATPTTWEIVDLGVLHKSEEAYSAAYDINDNGVVVGESGPVFNERYGFYWEADAMAPMPAEVIEAVNNFGVAVGNIYVPGPGGLVIQKNGDYDYVAVPQDWESSRVSDINNFGDVAGYVSVSGGQPRGFVLRHDGTFTVVEPLPGDLGAQVVAINDSGAIAGVSISGYYNDQYRGFVLSEGSLTEINFYPEDINNQGDIVGSSGGQAFLYRNGSIQPIGFLPGDSYSIAYGINDAGDITGRSGSRAFLRKSSGEMIDLTALPEVQQRGLGLYEARAINNVGQIVGQTGQRAFLLTPTAQ